MSKEKPSKRFTVTISDKMHKELSKIAALENRSINNYLYLMIMDRLKEYKK